MASDSEVDDIGTCFEVFGLEAQMQGMPVGYAYEPLALEEGVGGAAAMAVLQNQVRTCAKKITLLH